MSSNLQKKLKKLKFISQLKNKSLRNKVASDLCIDDDTFNALREIAVNTLKGKIPLTQAQKKKVTCQHELRCLACTDKEIKGIKKRRKLTNQLGDGFWGILVPIILDLLVSNIKGKVTN